MIDDLLRLLASAKPVYVALASIPALMPKVRQPPLHRVIPDGLLGGTGTA